MKIAPAVALLAVGLLTVAPRLSVAQEAEAKVVPLLPDVSVFQLHRTPNSVEFRSWHQGEPPLKLIRKEEGFCVLTGVGGGFAGGGEEVHAYIGDDGYWYLGGKSMQEGVSAECAVVRLAPAPAAKAKRVKILAASYCYGSERADVTERVRALLHEGTTFQANPGWLKADPHPYGNKALVIFCKIGHQHAIFSAGENEDISRELLLKNARPLAGEADSSAE